ncbi:MAG: DUF192 domain-containing protein [Candidatus Obscuribacterales bacterium]|nr:DUF192 domain-containing protein [Candidatus Obscuribacterales bacterium]
MAMIQRWLVAVLALIALATVFGAPAKAEGKGFPRTDVTIVTVDGKSHLFHAELAAKPEQLMQGLMYRRTLAADAGMLFDFGENRGVSMWMKNTLIPLDMIFITENGRIAGIAERTVPLSLETVSSPGLVRSVLEVNGGTASRLGIKPGDRVIHSIFSQAR